MTAGGRAKPQRHTPGNPGWYRQGDMLKLAEVAISEPFKDRDTDPAVCRRCTMVLDIDKDRDLEPTPLCHLCAQDAAYMLGAELLRIHEVIKTFPPVIAGAMLAGIANKPVEAQAFIDQILALTRDHAIKAHAHATVGKKRRGRRKK